jgi:predicted nuclease with RNAse H fold
MGVLGIDLAAGAKKTYACLLEAGRAELFAGCDDARLLELADGCEKVAIDAPFGWPRAFVEALLAHRRFEAWPAPDDGPPETFRATLSFRATDRVTMHTRRPLSVSTDKLGVTAMRCAHLLHRWSALGHAVDRAGAGRFVEVYPAGALVRWGFDVKGYKDSASALEALFAAVTEAAPPLELSAADRALCSRSDDALDALVAALVARAAQLGLTDLPPQAVREQAEEEGWIHLPLRGSLPFLDGRGLRPRPALGSLAADAFGPWLTRDESVPLGGASFTGATRLEQGDLLVDGPHVLAVASKGIETFSAHEASFAPGSADAVDELADKTWRAEFERLVEDPRRYRFLDAARLVEHYLGLRRRFDGRPVTLAYLYWQPANAAELAPCAIHAAEVAELARRVGDRRVHFVPMSSGMLWDEWAAAGRPWLREHVAALRERYDVEVQSHP